MDISPIVAYLDPGTGSLLLQALVGGGAGLAVFLRHCWKTYHPFARKT
jgi:hypothetical protein